MPNRRRLMPDAFLSPPAHERKDIWICWALDILFANPTRHPMAFKGGTSLSKVYRVIDRFSEDVDLILDYLPAATARAPSSTSVRPRGLRICEPMNTRTQPPIRSHVGVCTSAESVLKDALTVLGSPRR